MKLSSQQALERNSRHVAAFCIVIDRVQPGAAHPGCDSRDSRARNWRRPCARAFPGLDDFWVSLLIVVNFAPMRRAHDQHDQDGRAGQDTGHDARWVVAMITARVWSTSLLRSGENWVSSFPCHGPPAVLRPESLLLYSVRRMIRRAGGMLIVRRITIGLDVPRYVATCRPGTCAGQGAGRTRRSPSLYGARLRTVRRQ